MDDDDQDMDEPRQGPPGRAALIRERHEAMLARKRHGHSRLPPGVVAERLGKAPSPLRSKTLRAKHITATPARESVSQTIVIHTSEAKPMPDISPTLVSMAAKQAAEGLTNAQLATLLHCSDSSVSNLKAGRTQASVALLGRIKCWVEGQPIPEPPLAPKAEKKPAALPERPADRPILPGPVLADRIAAGREMSEEDRRQVGAELRKELRNYTLPEMSEEDMAKLRDCPGEISTITREHAKVLGLHGLDDALDIAGLLRQLGAVQAADAIISMRQELRELRAMRDGLRKLVPV